MKLRIPALLVLILTLLSACAKTETPTPVEFPLPQIEKILPTNTPISIVPAKETSIILAIEPAASTVSSIPTPDVTKWKTWPVIPELHPEMLSVYANGQRLGRNAHVVSVVGDCESSSDWFLKDFSKDERYYDLGPYSDLQKTIDYFGESLGYQSYAALRGATAVTVLTPLWADTKACNTNETPLACEYRLHNPSFVIIALGTNDVNKSELFEPKMREIIEYTLEQGIVPILVTKADNVEGDESINLTIAKLAAEYRLPVWNFWAAAQVLPNHGLQEDGVHLTFGSNFFNDPQKLERAWPVRNLTALQVLEAMRLAVQEK